MNENNSEKEANQERPLSPSEDGILITMLKRLYKTTENPVLRNHAKGIVVEKTLH